jgi:putative NADPH-quinone reductase
MRQQRKVLIIQGHPDASAIHLCHVLADQYAAGAREAGFDVHELSIAAIDFPILRSKRDFDSSPLPPALKPVHEAIMAADHIVLIFPLWLGSMPALVKAFFEQLFRPGLAFVLGKKGLPTKLFAGRTAHVVVTMGMPSWIYRLIYFAHGVRSLNRNILAFVGIRPVRTTMFGLVEAASQQTREKWCRQMSDAGRCLK